jgi:hypothetical protein
LPPRECGANPHVTPQFQSLKRERVFATLLAYSRKRAIHRLQIAIAQTRKGLLSLKEYGKEIMAAYPQLQSLKRETPFCHRGLKAA